MGGYLLGSISPSYIFYKKATGKDIREAGDGNPGAANIFNMMGSTPAFIVAFIDYCKGIVPLFVARILGTGDFYLIPIGMATVIGHDYSIFLKFRGGKGTLTSLGVLSFYVPIETILAFSVWLFIHYILKIRFIGSLITFILVVVFTWAISCRLLGGPFYYLLLPSGIGALFLLNMYGNIRNFFQKGFEKG